VSTAWSPGQPGDTNPPELPKLGPIAAPPSCATTSARPAAAPARALLALGLLTGLVAGLTARSANAGTATSARGLKPLLSRRSRSISGLADADTTAAQAFLAGGLEPPR